MRSKIWKTKAGAFPVRLFPLFPSPVEVPENYSDPPCQQSPLRRRVWRSSPETTLDSPLDSETFPSSLCRCGSRNATCRDSNDKACDSHQTSTRAATPHHSVVWPPGLRVAEQGIAGIAALRAPESFFGSIRAIMNYQNTLRRGSSPTDSGRAPYDWSQRPRLTVGLLPRFVPSIPPTQLRTLPGNFRAL